MNRMKKSGYVTTTDVDQSKIKAGLYIINREDNQRVVKFYCNCGNNKDEMRDVTYSTHITHTCSECGNQYFLRSHDNNKVTRMGAFILHNVRTTLLDFTRSNFSAKVIDDEFVITRVNMQRRFHMDFVKQIIWSNKNGVKEFFYSKKRNKTYIDGKVTNSTDIEYKIKAINTFMKQGVGDSAFYINAIRRASNINDFPYDTIERTTDFLESIKGLSPLSNYFSRWDLPSYAYLMNIYDIMKLDDVQPIMFLEKFLSANIPIRSSMIVQVRYGYSKKGNRTRYYETSSHYDNFDFTKKKLHQIIGAPREFISMMREYGWALDGDNLSKISDLFGKGERTKNKAMDLLRYAIENNVVNEVWNNIDKLLFLIQAYNYNIETLINYVYVVCPMYQGLTNPNEVLTILKDYIQMSESLGYRFDKYPNSLKLSHDVKMVNYRTIQNQRDYAEFENAVHEYGDLIFQDKKYQVLIPRTPKDLVKEGSSLNHCIASYKGRVIQGNSLIFFVRERKTPNVSLVSVELNKYYQMVQARGMNNRPVTTGEQEFINKWLEFVHNVALPERLQIVKEHEMEAFE